MNSTKKILILSANPLDTSRLRLDEEVREIEEGLRRARDEFIVESRWAVRVRDLRRALLDSEPNIVHFCGHGDVGGLILEDSNGNPTLVSSDALAGLFELFTYRVECVFLNACYSSSQAEAIAQYIRFVIGMSKGISDRAAIEFAVGFYDALGAGKSIEEAFKFGRNAIQAYNIPEHLTPLLKRKENRQGQTPDAKFDSTTVPTKEVMPILVFVYDSNRGWTIRNIGNSPSLSVIVATRQFDGGWYFPVRIPAVAVNQEYVLHWLGHANVDVLGATYSDVRQTVYSTVCAHDDSQVFSGRVLPEWSEEEIRADWKLKLE